MDNYNRKFDNSYQDFNNTEFLLNYNPPEEYRNEYEELFSSDEVIIKFKVSESNGFLAPDKDGLMIFSATFKTYTYEDDLRIDEFATEESITNEMKRRSLVLRRCLLDWCLDISIQREDDWITTESFKKVNSIPSPLIERLLDEYEQHYVISEEEMQKIDRQCAVLFSDSSNGVTEANRAVSLYCTLSNFWDKFGLNKFDLEKLSYKDFCYLRFVVGKESESTKRRLNKGRNKSNGRVSIGGKVRQSRGVVQRD